MLFRSRELVINDAEAETVREIFNAYIRLGSVVALRAYLDEQGIVSKHWVSGTGRSWGGARFSRGALRWLLGNPVYVGRVSHKGQVYEGRQKPIVDLATWERAQQLLASKSAPRQYQHVIPSGRLLMGRIFDDRGNVMSPSYTTRPSGKRYAYYVSQALLQNEKDRAGSLSRVPAQEVERVVLDRKSTRLNSSHIPLSRMPSSA